MCIRDSIIADLMGPEVALIDPGRETALAARDALASAGLLREGRAGTARYYVCLLYTSRCV